MNEFLCHPGRTFTIDELHDQAEAVQERLSHKFTGALCISDINLSPVSDPDELRYLAGLSQFSRIPDKVLFKIVRVATGLEVRDRWAAIRAIIARRIPIPVPKPLTDIRHG